MSIPNELLPGETVQIQTRPAAKSFWVFLVGALVCGIGPFLRENPPLSPQLGLVFTVVFVLIIFRRWSESYILTERRLLVRGGLFARETMAIDLADVIKVEAHQGLTLRLVGAGHLLVSSRRPDQGTIIMYGQSNPHQLRDLIETAAASLRGERTPNQTGPEEETTPRPE